MANSNRLPVGAGMFVLGLVLALVVPSSWVFTDSGHGAGGGEDGVQYACPMFCVVMDEKPDDGRCPVCGMELGPVSGEARLSPDERAMIGLETAKLRRAPLVRTVRVVGEVDYDETRLSRITTRTTGWLEEVWVDTTWTEVVKDAPLASIYSPELYAAQKEFLVGLGSEALQAGARRRLELLGIGAEEIETLAKTRKVKESIVLRSPQDGLVVERRAVEGAAVKKGELLYAIADLSRVWIQAEVFEEDLPWVRVGQEVRLEVASLPEPLVARLSFVDPVIRRASRTARVRIEVANPVGPDGRRALRIGQRVDVWIEARLGDRGQLAAPGEDPVTDPLTVPRAAVLRTGERAVVYVLYVERPDGTREYALDPERLPEVVLYEMVEVRPGPLGRDATGAELYALRDAGPVPVGAVLVTQGNLLLDSQAQLSGAPSLLFPAGSRGGDAAGHGGH